MWKLSLFEVPVITDSLTLKHEQLRKLVRGLCVPLEFKSPMKDRPSFPVVNSHFLGMGEIAQFSQMVREQVLHLLCLYLASGKMVLFFKTETLSSVKRE